MFTTTTLVVGSDGTERLDAYLYFGTERVITGVTPTRIAALLTTSSDTSQDDADYLADYQAGRLSSGLYGVTRNPTTDQIKQTLQSVMEASFQ